MNNNLLQSIHRLEESLKNCKEKDEAMRVFCMQSANLFNKQEEVLTRIIKRADSFFCEKGKQKKIPFSLPFKIYGKEYLFQVFFPNKINAKFDEQDLEILSYLARIINKRIGNVDFNYMKEISPCNKLKFLDSNSEKNKHSSNIFKNFYERDLLFDLMPFKVKEILLIASLYDAFTIEHEGNFTQKILGEFSKLNLTSFPRITAVSLYHEAFEQICSKHFDLIIVMVGNDKKTPVETIKSVRKDFKFIPVYFLLNHNADAINFIDYKFNGLIDNLFIWNGDSRIFFTMIKLLEDRINLDNDVKMGHSRIILLVEDTPRFYSRYLPELYMIIFEQTKNVMESITEADELYKVLSIRVRPKILLASTYEEALSIFEKYKDNFLSLITDVEFYRDGVKDKESGIDLVKYIQTELKDVDIPIVVQSRNLENKIKAEELDCVFIHKESETLAHDIHKVVKYNMGFGDFVYRDSKGNFIGKKAKNLDEFSILLDEIPDESLMYHAFRNHFSIWLMARGEINFAEILARLRLEDFKDVKHARDFLRNTIKRLRYEKTSGKIVEFNEFDLLNQSTVVTLSSGALGGKGRGLVFINKLVYSFGLNESIKDINIATPSTFIIGTDSFDRFIENNDLRDIIFNKKIDFDILKALFLEAKLEKELVQKLSKIVEVCNKPFAARSSGLFEDSLMQPFAGIFETYLIPNKHGTNEERLQTLINAVKLVYASVFSPLARDYFKAIDYKIEEEKMAVVIQQVIGDDHKGYYYPHISGTAESYNYYPYSHIKPDDGLASIALGLGTYVVGGGKTYHFTPKFPKIMNSSLKALVNNSQNYFYAIDLNRKKINLLEGENAALKKIDLWEAEQHGTLKHLVSVYDPQNNILSSGIDKVGPRVLNFANILKHKYIPLAKTIDNLLKIIKEAMGSAVEIEFAIDLNKDKDNKATFYLLQIKPLIGDFHEYNIELDKINKDKLLFFSNNTMGNGTVDKIRDVVYVDHKKFNKAHTKEMAKDFEMLNKKFLKEDKNYILIAPGRLGSRDRWLGVPVAWSQISKAKIIVETSLPHFPLDASAGSHFFHNVVSMGVGYFSIQHSNPEHLLKWELLDEQKIIFESEFVKHVRFSKPLKIKMDGKKRISIIEI